MAWTHEIWKICTRCKGAGEVITTSPLPEPPIEPEYIRCPICKGVGRFLWGGLKEKEVK